MAKSVLDFAITISQKYGFAYKKINHYALKVHRL